MYDMLFSGGVIMQKILVVEDDLDIQELLTLNEQI